MNMGQKSVPAGRHTILPCRRQAGAAILIFLILLVVGGFAYLFSGIPTDGADSRRTQQTQEALERAREALIGYALQYREQQIATGTLDAMYGYLPMPDVGTSRFHGSQPASCNTEGCAMQFINGAFPADTDTVIGRFPWRTLGLEPIRDGSGECLWYAVSANHKNLGISTTVRMNWDTLSHLDVVVADGGAALATALASAHERPVAVIFSPGPALPGQDRSNSASDSIARCGGNYDVANYLDPSVATALGGDTNYLAGSTNNASGTTDATAPKKLSTQGRIYASGSNLLPNACEGANCTIVANDRGLALGSDMLFGAIRKSAYFRTDINSMLDRITDCLRDSGVPGGHGKIAGADNDPCYGSGVVPLGYYPNYKDMIYVAGGSPNVNGNSCAGALLFGSQRNSTQLRDTAANRSIAANYLEPPNLAGPYSGPDLFERVSPTQIVSQDIVRCIPATQGFVTTTSPGLTAAGLPQMASYDPGTRTITLGQTVVGSALASSVSNFLYGSAWRPEKRTLGSGLRSYFTFRINDVGGAAWPTLGFTFTLADGDNNDIDASGAAAQHLGYSGNNTESPFIVPPKIAFEVDLRRETGFDPSLADHLLNGRNDPFSPSYRGGHVAIDYWGGETAINTTRLPPCTAPAYDSGGTCYLPQEEDDNVHARTATFRSGFPAPPANPVVPVVPLSIPPGSPAGAYKLDPEQEGTPTELFHVRVELRRSFFPSYNVVTASNIDINNPGNPINGVTLSAGDRVWASYQTAVPERGFYIWNGAAIPMTRISDDDPTTDYYLPRVRVATTANIADFANPGDSIDGVSLSDGDWILVKDQTVQAQNGIYVWKAANQPMIRASDANTAAELTGLIVEVRQGTQNASSIWRQNSKFLVNCAPADRITCNNDISWTNYRVKLAVAAPPATDLSNPGASLDGSKMKVGDRVLVKNNGVYIWKGANVPLELAPDIVAGSSIVQIQQGSEATALWVINGASSLRLSTVRVASQSNLNLAAPGASIDNIAMVAGDRVLVKNQTISAENGIYDWNGAAIPMTRTADADDPLDLAGTMTQVMAGSHVGRSFRQSALAAGDMVGTSAVQWAAVDRSTSYLLEIWLLPEPNDANKIAAMKDTTRPMSLLYPTYSPHLQDRPVIPYPFRNVRPGFTVGQRTSVNDQNVTIGNYFTTWLE